MSDFDIYKVNLNTPQPNGRLGESPRVAFSKYNDALDAINEVIGDSGQGQVVSNVAPPTPIAYMEWIDTSSLPAITKIRNANNTGWVGVGETLNPLSALGTAAYVETGTGSSDVPLNSDLGAAAYVNTGTGLGDVPLNSNLGAAAFINAVPTSVSGTANAITASFTPAITVLTNGLTLYVRAASANSTTTPTFQADGTAAKTIVKGANEALLAGDIKGAGHWLEMQYDSMLDKWVLQNPAIGVGVTQSFGASGWQKLSSGLIIQWGRVSITSGQAAADAVFPITFPTACRNISLADNATSSVAIQSQGVDLVTTTGFRVWTSNTNGDQPYWLAIGH